MSTENGQSPALHEEDKNADSEDETNDQSSQQNPLNNGTSNNQDQSNDQSSQQNPLNNGTSNNQDQSEETNLLADFFPTLKKCLTWDVRATIKSTKPLTVCLVILQGVSGYTTIRGAMIVFSRSNIMSG